MAETTIYVFKNETTKTVTYSESSTVPSGSTLLMAQLVLIHETAAKVAGYVADKLISTARSDWTVTAASA